MTTGMEGIRQSIANQANDKARALLEEASRERDSILSSAKEEAERSRTQILSQAAEEAAVRYEERLGAIRTELKKELLLKREEFIEKAWREAEAKLGGYVESDGYRSQLKHTVIDAAKLKGEGPFRVDANARDLAFLQKTKKEIEEALPREGGIWTMTLGKKIDCIGGAQVSDPKGNITIDRTYDSRMRRLRTALRPELAKILSEGQE